LMVEYSKWSNWWRNEGATAQVFREKEWKPELTPLP
jgi:hypothetical protein